MLFQKPINLLEETDVEQFCKEFPEGQRVEFKKTWNDDVKNKIPKIIASFANTLGGILVIGADASGTLDNKARMPFCGFKDVKGLEELVIQKCLSGINPAVLPEVKAIPLSGEPGNMILIVGVEESIQTPHAIENSTQIYYRTGNQSNPYKLADIDKMEKLFAKRIKPEEFKKQLIEKAEKRLVDAYNFLLIEDEEDQTALHAKDIPYPTIEIFVSPVYPSKPLMTPSNLYLRCEAEFPTKLISYFSSSSNDHRGVQDGIQSVMYDGRKPTIYTEINIYGLIYQVQSLDLFRERGSGDEHFPIRSLIAQIYVMHPFSQGIFKLEPALC